MERRLLFAFLLSTALILGYQLLYYGPRMRKVEEAKRAQAEIEAALQSQQATETTAPETPPAPEPSTPAFGDTVGSRPLTLGEPSDDPAGLPPARGADNKVIYIETPLFHMTITSAGGEIISTRLLEFKTDGEPVEVVRSDTPGQFGMATLRLVGDERSLALSDVFFEPYLEHGNEPLRGGSRIAVTEPNRPITLVFRAEAQEGGRIERRYEFSADSYLIAASVNYSPGPFSFARKIEWGLGPGMTPTEPDIEDDFGSFRASAMLGEELYRKKRGDFKEDYSGVVQWTSLKTKYFTAILIPPESTGGEATLAGVKADNFLTAAMRLPATARQGRVQQNVDLYLGPLDYRGLKAMGRSLERNVDIGFESFKILQPLSKATLWAMLQMHKVIPNYGLVIILISVVTKVLFYRLTHKSFKSMADMQALQPRIAALKEKYKDDRQKLSQETMRLYKESGVNPLGGCLPMLLQMPVFIALFNVLRNTIEVRRAPFFGWMDDLSRQDVLFNLPMSLPFIGDGFSVLPILMGVGMFAQSKIGGSIAGPESGATQPKAMMYMMPIVFTVLFYRMPSGLVLYWLVNTVLSVAQQYYINKGAKKPALAAGDDVTPNIPSTDGAQVPAEPRPKSNERPKPKSGRSRRGRRKSRAKKG